MAYDGIYAREFTHEQQLPTENDNEPKISIRALSKKCQPFIHGVRIHINSPVEGDQSVGNAANMSVLGRKRPFWSILAQRPLSGVKRPLVRQFGEP